MITIQKAKIITDEKVQEAVFEVIADRQEYYTTLFESAKMKPEITIRFENMQPFRLRITFRPYGEKPIMIDIEGYAAPDVVMKHAFKKLRRTAKNYFTKHKLHTRRRDRLQ